MAIGSKGVTRPGETRVFEGEGMPVFERDTKGHLYITFAVSFPKTVTEAQAKALRELLADVEYRPPHDEL